MGGSNSKNECNQGKSNNNNQENTRQRLYTEDELQRVLQYQKRLYNEKLLAGQNRIYPNLQSELTNSPSTSNSCNIMPTAPPMFLLHTTETQTSGAASQIIPLHEPAQKHEYPTPGPSTSTLVSQESNNQRRNTKPKQRANSSSRMTNRRTFVHCVTCKGEFGTNIYQCNNGHSSCQDCKSKMKNCGTCCELITNMRNITLEATIAPNIVDDMRPKPCSFKSRGCKLNFRMDDMEAHLTECIFSDLTCPSNDINNSCNWKGMMKDVFGHLCNMHPENCQAEVNKEMSFLLSSLDYKVFHVITLNNFHFILHIQIDTSLNNIYMVVQCLGTKVQASKWAYELHIYQKKTPRRKFEYIDICQPLGTPVSDIITACNCAIININHAKTFLDSGKMTYKVYIKKNYVNK